MKEKIIVRDKYLSFLKSYKDHAIIKVISGVRRSGKSVLLDTFKGYLLENGISEERVIFINFEAFENKELTDPEVLHEYIVSKLDAKAITYIILDEVQIVEDFEKVINSLYLKENVDIYITGSNAYFLSGELATFLTGRYIELYILPLSFKEFYDWHLEFTDEKDKNILFERYLKTSFPYALSLETDEQILAYLQGIYSTVVLNDIVKRLNVQNVRTLERLIETLFSQIGSLVSVNKIKNTLKSEAVTISNNTVDKYIQGILDSLIMYSCKRYNIHGRELLQTGEKYYGVDIGLRNLVLRDHLKDYGYIIENIVYLELLRRGNKVYVGQVGNLEVDFVCVKSDRTLEYYQVSLTTLDESTLERELRPLNQINDSYKKYLITLDIYNKEANYEGIEKVHLIDWLLNE